MIAVQRLENSGLSLRTTRCSAPQVVAKIVGSSGRTIRQASSAVNDRIGAISLINSSRMIVRTICAERRPAESVAVV